MSDYASELADRIAQHRRPHNEVEITSAIEEGIRQALAKAAEVLTMDCGGRCLHGSCAVMREAQNRVRALGAKP